MTVALKALQCCSWQHEDTQQCWNISYVEHQRGFVGVRKKRNHQDGTAGAATEGRCSPIIMTLKHRSTPWLYKPISRNAGNTLKLRKLLTAIEMVEM